MLSGPSSACCTCTTRRAARSTWRCDLYRCTTRAVPCRCSSSVDRAADGARAEHTKGLVGRSPAFSRCWGACRAWRRTDAAGAAAGRDRHRQGVVARAIHEASARAARRSSRSTARASPRRCRERAVRPREGRVHRRGGAQPGLVEAAAGGTLFLDEIGDLPLRPAAQAAAAARDRHVQPRRRHRAAARRRPPDRGHPPRPAAAWCATALPRRPVLPPRRAPDPPAAAARAPRRTSRCWWSAAVAPRRARRTLDRRRARRACGATTGRATSASCATCSSAPACSPTATPSSRSTCRRRSVPPHDSSASRAPLLRSVEHQGVRGREWRGTAVPRQQTGARRSASASARYIFRLREFGPG